MDENNTLLLKRFGHFFHLFLFVSVCFAVVAIHLLAVLAGSAFSLRIHESL